MDVDTSVGTSLGIPESHRDLVPDADFSFFERVLRHYEADPATIERGTRATMTFVPRRVVAFGERGVDQRPRSGSPAAS